MMPTNLDHVRRAGPRELACMLTDMIDQYICPLKDKDGADRTLDCVNTIMAWLGETNLPEVKVYV